MNSRLKSAISFIKKKYQISKLPEIILTDYLDCEGQINFILFDGKINANIEINDSLSLDTQIKAIFHESAHWLQYLRGDLQPLNKVYKSICYAELPYFQQPHEIEARIFANNNWIDFNKFMREKACKNRVIVLN